MFINDLPTSIFVYGGLNKMKNNVKGKKKVLLIVPPTGICFRDGRCQGSIEELTAQPDRIPMELAYVASILEKGGFECKLRDFPIEKASWTDVRKEIDRFCPDVLIVSIGSPTVDFDLKVCKAAKERNSNCVTIAKGAHLMHYDKEVMNKFKDLDIAVRLEVEAVAMDLLKKDKLDNILGITYRRDDDKIVQNKDRGPFEELDKLPFPARHLLRNDLYIRPDTKESLTVIMTGRGCPFRCIFCLAGQLSNYNLVVRDYKKVVDEIEYCIKEHNIKNFFFLADTFTFHKEWVINFCKEVLNRKLKIEWGTNSRVDTVDEDRIKWMKKSGCYVIGFGVESGTQESLNKTKKGITLEQSKKATSLCRKYGIKSYLLFMIGFPWETKAMINKTIKFAIKLDGAFADFNVAYPYPGTEMFYIAKKDNLFNEAEICGHDISKAMLKTRYVSTDELMRLRKKAIIMFYFRPKYIFRTLLGIRSPRVFFNYLKKGFQLLSNILRK